MLSTETERATELGGRGVFRERVESAEEDDGIEGDAEEHVGAVLSTFEETVGGSDWEGVRAPLPDGYDRLL